MIPVISPFSGGTPDAIAMPMHKGIATRNTTIDAVQARPRTGRDGRIVEVTPDGKAPRGAHRDRQRLVFTHRKETPAVAVEREHLAGVDIDEPAVERDLAARDPRRDRRMRAQMRDLHHDILEARRAHRRAIFEIGVRGV